MKILGIDTSAAVASAAVCEVGETPKVVACGSINTKLTHSQTLMPFIENLLASAKVSVSEIDAFAAAAGPGSFTGLRIGISAVKGMAYALKKPCRAVSTLLGMAYNFETYDGILCAAMDARCNQLYNALFEVKDGRISRITEERALFIPDLEKELNENYGGRKVLLCGDGAELAFSRINHDGLKLAPASVRFQSGTGICFAAAECSDIEAAALMPAYLRLPQAERERLAKINNQQNNQ